MRAAVCIGTRGSDLALVQARTVAGVLRGRLGVDSTLVVVATAGDRDRGCSLPLGALAAASPAGGLEPRAVLATIDAGVTAATLRRCAVHGAGPDEAAALAFEALAGGLA